MDNNEQFTGVLGDPREDIRVQKGHSIDEVLAGDAPVNWRRKAQNEIKRYPVWNQHGTSACVAFSKAKQLSIRIYNMTGVWIDFSPASIYQLRANRPEGGMNIADANKIVNESGATLEALMKSQNLTEAEIMAVKRTKVADLFAKAIAEAVVSYLYIPVDIDRVAQTIEAGKAVSLLIYAETAEYSRLRPVITNPNLSYLNAPVRHEIVAVDYGLDDAGNKIIYCEDSAHFGGLPVRELTADFLHRRCILADALDVFTFEPADSNTPKPSYNGTIVSVQKCLKYEGLLAQEVQEVENFGPLTQKAVMKFQVKYGLHPTGVPSIGPATKAKLKELYP
jgi:hypothetical protein